MAITGFTQVFKVLKIENDVKVLKSQTRSFKIYLKVFENGLVYFKCQQMTLHYNLYNLFTHCF